jgi:hypothetical protein
MADSASPSPTALIPLHLEVRLRSAAPLRLHSKEKLADAVGDWLHDNFQALLIGDTITDFGSSHHFVS